MPSPAQTADAIARLERYRRMITLDEAVEILTGRKAPFARRAREAARNFWLDISHAATAPFRKVEDVIESQEENVRDMLAFVGASYDPRCLDFHENRRYARTASYAQVAEPLYDSSRFRHRNYLKQLEPVIPILEPVITRLGYAIG